MVSLAQPVFLAGWFWTLGIAPASGLTQARVFFFLTLGAHTSLRAPAGVGHGSPGPAAGNPTGAKRVRSRVAGSLVRSRICRAGSQLIVAGGSVA